MLPLPVQLFATDLAHAKPVNLHVVGAVYGAKLDWLEAYGQEPPAEVVRSPNACPNTGDKLDQADRSHPV